MCIISEISFNCVTEVAKPPVFHLELEVRRKRSSVNDMTSISDYRNWPKDVWLDRFFFLIYVINGKTLQYLLRSHINERMVWTSSNMKYVLSNLKMINKLMILFLVFVAEIRYTVAKHFFLRFCIFFLSNSSYLCMDFHNSTRAVRIYSALQ